MAQDHDNLSFKYGERGSKILREFNEKRARERQGSVQTSARHPTMRPAKRTFQAAGINRQTSSFLTADIALNTLLESQLPIIVARSRYLARNTPPGRRFLTLVKNNVVGPHGFRLVMEAGAYVADKWVLDKVANRTIQDHWKRWCRAEHCDVTGQSSFTDLCRLVAEVLARDGEFLVKEVVGTKDTPYRYQLQMLAIDRLDINYHAIAPNGNVIRMGVEVNTAGKPVAYHVLVRNPNDRTGAGAASPQYRERIGAEDIIHRFVRIDPEQLRGVPWAHAIMTGQNMLHMFEEAAVTSAVVGASNMGFFKPPAPGDAAYAPPGGDGYGSEVADGVEEGGDLVREAVPGAFETLPPGWEFEKFDPAYPHTAFDPFVQSRKRDMASGVDIAHHNLTGDMTGVNYASARIAELTERDNWRAIGRMLAGFFAVRVASRWLELGLLSNALVTSEGNALSVLDLDKYKDGITFKGRGWDWVDPLNEAQAGKLAVDEGFATRSQIVAGKGGDFEDNVIELAHEAELLEEHGVELGPKMPATPIAKPDDDKTTNGGADGPE